MIKFKDLIKLKDLIKFKEVKNSYYIMRHGESLGNIEKIIVSDPGNGLFGYGLTPAGKKQAADALKNFSKLDDQTIIYSSDFLRTTQTACIAAKIIKPHSRICFTPHLRERFFGKFELTPSDNYKIVWSDDLKDQQNIHNQVETVDAVFKRVLLCLGEIEENFDGKNILMVSHGDTLQILSAYFKGWPPYRHREVEHLGVAEIRKVGGI